MKKLAFLIALASGRAQALSLQPLVHIDLRGGYAALEGQSSTPLFQGEVFAVPAVQFTEAMSLTPSLYVMGGGQQRSLEEAALFVETASVGFRPQVKYKVADGSSYVARMEARHVYNVEAVNETPGTGRYDYEDYRVGGGWDSVPSELPFGASLELNHRSYPNYHNIGAAVALTDSKNYYQKDYVGTKGEAHLGLSMIGKLAASVEWKAYSDSYVVSAVNGLVDTSQPQQDLLYDVSLRGTGKFNPGFALAWTLGWQASASNQNTFDTQQAVGLANSTDYSATSAGLNAQWKTAPNGLLVMGGYTAIFRNFNRPIQTPGGVYTAGMVAEVEHDLNLGLSLPLGAGISGVAGGEARYLLSNQQYAAAGIPNYNYYTGTVGLQWDWQGAH